MPKFNLIDDDGSLSEKRTKATLVKVMANDGINERRISIHECIRVLKAKQLLSLDSPSGPQYVQALSIIL